jgi:hypothetical protein
VRIPHHARAARDVRLPQVDRRPATLDELRVKDERPVENLGHDLAGQIVVGRPKPAGDHDQVRPRPREFQPVLEVAAMIAVGRVVAHVAAAVGEGTREPDEVAVGAAARHQFGAGGNDFGDHSGEYREFGDVAPSTSMCPR